MMISNICKKAFSTATDVLSTKNMRRFGIGEFPKSLLHSRPFRSSTTSNGIRVGTQLMTSNLASISVFINCGSRNQTAQSSGTAHFLQHLHFKGTKNRTRHELQIGVENIGGNLNAYTSRENTSYMMTVFKKDIQIAVETVGDMLTNSLYRSQDVDNERSTIKRQLVETRKAQPLETTIQIAHRGIFKGHQMGLPILGDIQNMESISKSMIEQYHNDNYVGENIIVVASGDINHDELVSAVEKYFPVPHKSLVPRDSLQKPKFTPGVSVLEAPSQQIGVNMVVVHQAPSFFDNDFFTYLLLQRIISDRPENPFQIEIIKKSTSFRYQKRLAPLDFIFRQKGFYSAYWDAGLYGNYFYCKPEQSFDVIKNSLQAYNQYSNSVSEEELQRAKRRVYVQILHHESQNDITQSIANNLLYYNRRVHTKELAQRVAAITPHQIQSVAKKIVNSSKDMHVTFWGNTKAIPFK